eukprot:TRINITY_DN1079_c0_g1_i3.p2 TRINITY_DN1079_c0_g1~~TRINITY_DN1079_c0_g1_i3.p2  ORF type:complete len:108 (+),score=12.40 TRINITY_DN1079_c0_g1_i3:426-749(+)
MLFWLMVLDAVLDCPGKLVEHFIGHGGRHVLLDLANPLRQGDLPVLIEVSLRDLFTGGLHVTSQPCELLGVQHAISVGIDEVEEFLELCVTWISHCRDLEKKPRTLR